MLLAILFWTFWNPTLQYCTLDQFIGVSEIIVWPYICMVCLMLKSYQTCWWFFSPVILFVPALRNSRPALWYACVCFRYNCTHTHTLYVTTKHVHTCLCHNWYAVLKLQQGLLSLNYPDAYRKHISYMHSATTWNMSFIFALSWYLKYVITY